MDKDKSSSYSVTSKRILELPDFLVRGKQRKEKRRGRKPRAQLFSREITIEESGPAGRGSKSSFSGGLRGVLLLFSSKGRLGGCVCRRETPEQSQGVEPMENQRWERRKGRLRGQNQHRAPRTHLSIQLVLGLEKGIHNFSEQCSTSRELWAAGATSGFAVLNCTGEINMQIRRGRRWCALSADPS